MNLRPLNLTKKTGFIIKDTSKPVIIRDYNGMLFYTTEPMLPRVKSFNLPAGNYFIDAGYFVPMLFPLPVRLSKLPPHERHGYPDPSKFPIRFGQNPNKCSIFWDKKYILCDTEFQDKPQWVLDYILSHEFGHRYYNTEKCCDVYAANRMKLLGYNNSQIGAAPITTLSIGGDSRKKLVTDKLIDTANG